MTTIEKTLCGIGGGIVVAVGAAWGVYKLSQKYPNAAKFTIGVANEAGNVAADKISSRYPKDKPAMETVKFMKDVLADETKRQIDNNYRYHNSRWLP
jgi:hypothetical protein